MATQPRMSAPIGRVRIKTSARKPGSGDRWRTAEPPVEGGVEDVEPSEGQPRFYPFPLPFTSGAED